jgi:hypothetical protein
MLATSKIKQNHETANVPISDKTKPDTKCYMYKLGGVEA